MARRSKATARKDEMEALGIRGADLEPIRVVERELTSPDGTKHVVEVPVYPPFRLEDRAPKRGKGGASAEPKPRAGRGGGRSKANRSGD